jgi:hypothetical protein
MNLENNSCNLDTQDLKKILLDKINSSSKNGNIITSLFIPNIDKKCNSIVIEKMWNYFILNNNEFINLFANNKSIKILDINNDYIIKYKKIYNNIFEQLFLAFIKNLNNNYSQLLFTFNNISTNNICISYYNNQFYIIKISNDINAINKMNDTLINLNKFGNYIHILVTS